MEKKVGILCAAAIVTIIAVGGYYAYGVKSKPVKTDAVKYVKTTVERGSISVGVQATGTVFAPITKDIVTPEAGPLTLNYKLGDNIKKGEIIGKISDEDLQAQITKDLLSIQSQNLDLAQIKPEDTKSIEQKKLSIAQIQADLKAKQAQMNRTSIVSPVSGTVIAQNYDSGDIVQNGKTIITIADLTQFQLDVPVDELDIAKIKLGQKVNISFGALPDKNFDGQVVGISDVGKTTNNVTTYDVYVSINNPSGIKLGMNANVSIGIASKDNILLLPAEALQDKNGKDFVYVAVGNDSSQDKATKKNIKLSQDNVELKQIKVGLYNESTIEVEEGLSEGQEVMIPVPQTDTSSTDNTKGLKNAVVKQTNKASKTKTK